MKEVCRETLSVGLEVADQTGLQITREIVSAVAVRFERQVTVRMAATTPSRIGYEVGVHFAGNIARETGLRTDLRMPLRVAFRTTSRTVPGTVSKVVHRITP